MMSMDFLYFPQDKSEYIPAFITLTIFVIGAIVAVYLFYKYSKKEEKLIEEKYRLHEPKNKEQQKNELS